MLRLPSFSRACPSNRRQAPKTWASRPHGFAGGAGSEWAAGSSWAALSTRLLASASEDGRTGGSVQIPRPGWWMDRRRPGAVLNPPGFGAAGSAWAQGGCASGAGAGASGGVGGSFVICGLEHTQRFAAAAGAYHPAALVPPMAGNDSSSPASSPPAAISFIFEEVGETIH